MYFNVNKKALDFLSFWFLRVFGSYVFLVPTFFWFLRLFGSYVFLGISVNRYPSTCLLSSIKLFDMFSCDE